MNINCETKLLDVSLDPLLKIDVTVFLGACFQMITLHYIRNVLGMETPEIMKAVTVKPASAIGDSAVLGRVEGDLTVFQLEQCHEAAEDCAGHVQYLKTVFVPKYVVRKGELRILE